MNPPFMNKGVRHIEYNMSMVLETQKTNFGSQKGLRFS